MANEKYGNKVIGKNVDPKRVVRREFMAAVKKAAKKHANLLKRLTQT